MAYTISPGFSFELPIFSHGEIKGSILLKESNGLLSVVATVKEDICRVVEGDGTTSVCLKLSAYETKQLAASLDSSIGKILTPGEQLAALLDAHPNDLNHVATLLGLKPRVVSRGEDINGSY